MRSLPVAVRPYRRTPEFTEETVPSALTRSHRTRAGTWGRIVVLEGRLLYRILQPSAEALILDTDHPGIVEPEVEHEVEPIGKVRFYVEFYR